MQISTQQAHDRLHDIEIGRGFALPPTLQDAQAVPIPRDLLARWMMYAETHAPAHLVENYIWDIRRLAAGDVEFAEDNLLPLLCEWGDADNWLKLWTEADRPYRDSDVLVLEELASIHHNPSNETGLWVLLPTHADEAEGEAVKALNILFFDLDRAERLRLEEATGVTNPAALAAMLAKPLLTITEEDLRTLPFRDRLRVESEIMMARYAAAKVASNALLAKPANSSEPIADVGVRLEDFVAYMPAHSYIFKPTREMWPATSVNSRVGPIEIVGRVKPMQASAWLDSNRPVEQATWAPGEPMEIQDRLIADGGWIERKGCAVFNLYRPPIIRPKAGDAKPWVDHVRYVFGDDAQHIICWLAHRVQRPDQKVNHALVLGGAQGIGKDTLLEPVKQAIGPWNFAEVSPQQMLGRFNSFVKSVILRVSEARDLGDTDRFAFYEHMKTLAAAPPDVLRVDEKHLREHAVLNVCGVVLTTNNKDALHLPADDRRHFVAWSTRNKEDFPAGYWSAMYRWFAGGGNEIVAHYLATLDLSDFDAKAPPPKTQAFWEIVDASRAPEDAEMADALDQLGRPAAVTLDAIATRANIGFREWLRDRKNRRRIPHRMDECGYVPVRNPDVKDGFWIVGRARQVVYAKCDLSLRDQITAARRLTVQSTSPG